MTTRENQPSPIIVTEHWLEEVVIGLELCPFAAKPFQHQQIRIQIYDGNTEAGLLEALQIELTFIDERPPEEIETSILVISNLLNDFNAYNQFLNQVDTLLEEFAWTGRYQVASFHPEYCFAGVLPDSPENLTNRSPYPLLHIIREASIETALHYYRDPENIPIRNIRKMNALTTDEKDRLFSYLKKL